MFQHYMQFQLLPCTCLAHSWPPELAIADITKMVTTYLVVAEMRRRLTELLNALYDRPPESVGAHGQVGDNSSRIVISSRMEISLRISTNYRPCLCSSFCNAKLFCIVNSYWPLCSEGSFTHFETKLALIGFIVWHLWECVYQHYLSTVVKCQIFGRFIVNVQKALFWRKILFSLPINITNNTNFYHLKK